MFGIAVIGMFLFAWRTLRLESFYRVLPQLLGLTICMGAVAIATLLPAARKARLEKKLF